MKAILDNTAQCMRIKPQGVPLSKALTIHEVPLCH